MNVKLKDGFPGVLEVRKSSGDYGLLFSAPLRYLEYLKPLLEKEGRAFAVFPVIAEDMEQAEKLVSEQNGKSHSGPAVDVHSAIRTPQSAIMATLEELATAFAVEPRTIQNYADAGHLVRNAKGQYDLLASLVAMNRARKDAETSQGDALRDEKIQSVRINRQRREVELQEKLGNLVNRDLVRRAFEKVLALVRQRFVMMPKYMAPRLDGLSAKEQEPLLEDYARESLAALSAPDLGTTDAETRGQGDTGTREINIEKPVSRKARKGRKGGRRK